MLLENFSPFINVIKYFIRNFIFSNYFSFSTNPITFFYRNIKKLCFVNIFCFLFLMDLHNLESFELNILKLKTKLCGLMKNLGGKCPVICYHDHQPRGAVAYGFGHVLNLTQDPSVQFPSGHSTYFINPPKGCKAESTLPSPGIEPETCGVAVQRANIYATS